MSLRKRVKWKRQTHKQPCTYLELYIFSSSKGTKVCVYEKVIYAGDDVMWNRCVYGIKAFTVELVCHSYINIIKLPETKYYSSHILSYFFFGRWQAKLSTVDLTMKLYTLSKHPKCRHALHVPILWYISILHTPCT